MLSEVSEGEVSSSDSSLEAIAACHATLQVTGSRLPPPETSLCC